MEKGAKECAKGEASSTAAPPCQSWTLDPASPGPWTLDPGPCQPLPVLGWSPSTRTLGLRRRERGAYLLTYSLAHLLTYLLAYLLACLLTYLLTCLLAYLRWVCVNEKREGRDHEASECSADETLSTADDAQPLVCSLVQRMHQAEGPENDGDWPRHQATHAYGAVETCQRIAIPRSQQLVDACTCK